VALSAVHLVNVNFTQQYSGYVSSVTIATALAYITGKPQFPRLFLISPTNVKFPDFSGFSRRLATLQINKS